jgi:hypothetical protein
MIESRSDELQRALWVLLLRRRPGHLDVIRDADRRGVPEGSVGPSGGVDRRRGDRPADLMDRMEAVFVRPEGGGIPKTSQPGGADRRAVEIR